MDEFENNLFIDDVFLAFESLGFSSSGHCTALNSLENRVFLIGREKDSLIPDKFSRSKDKIGDNCILKIYRPNRWSKEQILEEHDFLNQLEEFEIPVISPLKDNSGNTIFTYKNYYYSIWHNQKGRLVEDLSLDSLPILGRLLARIHNIGESKNSIYRNTLTTQDYGVKSLLYIKEKKYMSDSLMKRYESCSYKIFELVDEFSKIMPFHRIHGDCHKGNLIKVENSFCFIDFDDSLMGPAVQDFWMLLPFSEGDISLEISLFLEGYREFREFNETWFKIIEPLRGLRYIHYAGWIAKRYGESNFKETFPHFGTEEYWENETNDLENLTKGIRSTITDNLLKIDNNQNNEKELTNKDFFWDLE